jgi:transcriptional regulator with XRE-family HTH domain
MQKNIINIGMENDLMTFAKRLQQARLKARLSMEKLCEKMNGLVTKQAISKYEKAKMMPSSTILISLAEVLDCDIDYFFRPFTFELDQFKVSFRKKSDTTAGDQKALKVQIQDEVERYLEIEDVLQLKPTALLSEPLVPSQPLSSSSDMVEMAQKVREAWQLGNAPILNAMELLEAHGIKVLLTEAPEDFDGVSGIVNDITPVIVLNSTNTHIERRRLTSFHELSHLLFNDYFSTNLTEHQKENLCNAFANEMLLPSAVLLSQFEGKNRSLMQNSKRSASTMAFPSMQLSINSKTLALLAISAIEPSASRRGKARPSMSSLLSLASLRKPPPASKRWYTTP